MIRPNIKYINTTEMLLAKRREQERLAQDRLDRACDILAWVLVLCVSLTAVLVVAAIQEGWW